MITFRLPLVCLPMRLRGHGKPLYVQVPDRVTGLMLLAAHEVEHARRYEGGLNYKDEKACDYQTLEVARRLGLKVSEAWDEVAPHGGQEDTDASQGREESMTSIDEVWARIEAHQGEEFRRIRGRRFRYSVKGSHLTPSTTRQNIPRSAFEEALSLVPLQNTARVQHLRGPSYIFAILMDERIRRTDW